MSRTDQLISDYLDGRLDPAGQKELAALLEQDRELMGEFLELYRQHRLLAGQQESVAWSTSVERVLSELRQEKADHAPAPVGARRATQPARKSFWRRISSFEFSPVPRVGWAAVGAVCIALILVGGFVFFGNTSISAVVKQAGPGVTLVRGGRSQACQEGMQLRTGDMLQTTADATAVVQYLAEPTMLELRANTQLRFQKTSHGKHLNLKSGEIAVVAGHQPTNAPMIFVTPHAEARVVGTRFQLAARRFSTWLQVSEGGVAFQRIASKGGAQEGANLEAASQQVLVRTGEYAVISDGIPLKTLQVTNGLDLAHPLPMDIGWFSYYAKPSWYVHPPTVQHVTADTTSRTFLLPAVKGSLMVSGTAAINSTKNPLPADQDAGFALGVSVKSDLPGVDGYMACIHRHEGQTTLEIVDENFGTIATLPVSIPAGPACKLKLALERTPGRGAWVRAKAWIGADEPQEWQLEKQVTLRDPSEVFELRLMTENSACTFENTSAFLIE